MAAEVVFDDNELRDFLRNLNSRLKDVKDGKKKYIGLLSAIVFKDVLDHFSTEESPDGKWNPWSDIYKQHMEEIGRAGNKLLQFSGRLRQNFKPTNSRSSDQGISWFNNAVTKSGFPYAWAHNEGSGKLPRREFMWLSDKAVDDMAEQTLQFMIEEDV